jgi:hypothetical protein
MEKKGGVPKGLKGKGDGRTISYGEVWTDDCTLRGDMFRGDSGEQRVIEN